MSDERLFNSLIRPDESSGDPTDSPESANLPDHKDSLNALNSSGSRLPTQDSGLPPVVMAVGGFDPSAGAGVLADIKTIAAMYCYGVAAVTSLTVQNTAGVYGAYHQTAQTVGEQMDALFDDFDVSAVKTGMLPSVEIVREVARRLLTRRNLIVVVDPVLKSSTGSDLAASSVQAMVTELFPLADLVTPNIAEAQVITGIPVTSRRAMETSARRIVELGPTAVLVKGGDLPSEKQVVDVLWGRDGPIQIAGPRISSRSTHGTGCTLASAIASLLARGLGVEAAARSAKSYVANAIKSAPGLGKGFGPLNHFEKFLS
jgi:hydroxymethylpyrimidine/phosphomethylpyrimidine kinase